MVQDRNRGNYITASICNIGGVGAVASSRTVYSRSTISRQNKIRYVDRVSVCPHVAVTSTISIVNVQIMAPSQAVGDGAGPATGVITLPHASCTTGVCGAIASAGQFT
jgi:hypothetical protein